MGKAFETTAGFQSWRGKRLPKQGFIKHAFFFDDLSGDFVDAISRKDLTPVGSPSYADVDAVENTSIDFPTTSDYAERTDGEISWAQGNSFGASIWFKTTYALTNEPPLIVWDIDANNYIAAWLDSSGQARYAEVQGGSIRAAFQGGPTPNDGNWHNVVITYNGNDGFYGLFFDGDQVGSSSALTTPSQHIDTSLADFRVGQWSSYGFGNQAKFDELYIWTNISLNENDAAKIYANGIGTFLPRGI